jgi:hypothetical protein
MKLSLVNCFGLIVSYGLFLPSVALSNDHCKEVLAQLESFSKESQPEGRVPKAGRLVTPLDGSEYVVGTIRLSPGALFEKPDIISKFITNLSSTDASCFANSKEIDIVKDEALHPKRIFNKSKPSLVETIAVKTTAVETSRMEYDNSHAEKNQATNTSDY